MRKLIKYNIPNQQEPDWHYIISIFGFVIYEKKYHNVCALHMAHTYGFTFLVNQAAKKHYNGS